MKMRKVRKYLGLALGCMAVCVVVIWTLHATQVLGSFKSEKPYVDVDQNGIPQNVQVASVNVTKEGGTQKDSMGLENPFPPCSDEVPTAIGKKGSETNPFVLLEVVPDKAMQQWTYLSGSVECGMPKQLDALLLGIEACRARNESFVSMPQLHNFDKIKDDYGEWIWTEYSVYKVGSNSKKEDMSPIELAQLYSLSISSNDLKNPEQFKADYEANKKDIAGLFEKYPELVESLEKQYPELFEKTDVAKYINERLAKKYKEFDENGKTRWEVVKRDSTNWKTDSKKHVLQEEKGKDIKTGYLVAVAPGKGDYGFASVNDFDKHLLTKTGTDKDRWCYVETEEELKRLFPGAENNDQRGMSLYNVWDTAKGIYWVSTRDYLDSPEITGLYMKIEENFYPQFHIAESPEVSEQMYTFSYYGLKSNELLKRSLFVYKDQDEYDNFHMKVICMTPAELNELAKKDTDKTLDMIERADMFSFQSYSSAKTSVMDVEKLIKLYHEKILEEKNYAYASDKVTTFYENDLEWDLCAKIIERESNNKNLPLVFNKLVGSMVDEGVTQDGDKSITHMFVTEGDPTKAESHLTNEPSTGSLNNISKLYLISIQFDLLARRDSVKEPEKRTFYQDIFPYIKKIALNDGKGTVENTATTTGYYDNRPLCGCTLDGGTHKFCNESDAFKTRSYYLWNKYTFFPTYLSVAITDLDGVVDEKRNRTLRDIYIEQGYLSTYFVSNVTNQIYNEGEFAKHHGSDGTDDKNATVVGDHLANVEQSFLLFDSDSTVGKSTVNDTFETAFQIMNGQAENVENLTVTVLKQKKWYEKINDNAVMIDYNSQAKYDADKTLYLKVRVSNTNNEAGIIEKISIVNTNGTGDPITLNIHENADDTSATEIQREAVKDSQNNDWDNPVKGYRVEANDTLTFFIPYSLYDWQKGYDTVRIATKAHMYNAKKEKFITGQSQIHDITISERTLFNLE